MKYSVKSNGSLQIKDVDEKSGVVQGYASVFNNVDSDGDILVKGAFSKSINERMSRIKHLWQHDPYQVIGVPTELKEDDNGLFFVSRFGKDSFSQDKLQQHKDGLITELSIGFNTIKSELDKETNANRITEVKLWEYSSVTWGANSLTSITSAKGEAKVNMIDKANKRMERLLKALKNGKYTDESCEQFEIEIKQIQQLYNELIQPTEDVTEEQKPTEKEVTFENEIKEFRKHLKL